MSKRTVISAEQVNQAAAAGRLSVPEGALVTPLARDLAAELGVKLEPAARPAAASPAVPAAASPAHAADSQDDELTQRIRTLVASMLAGEGDRRFPRAPR